MKVLFRDVNKNLCLVDAISIHKSIENPRGIIIQERFHTYTCTDPSLYSEFNTLMQSEPFYRCVNFSKYIFR